MTLRSAHVSRCARPAAWFLWILCACAWAQQVPSRITLSGTLIDPSETPVTSVLVRLFSAVGEVETLTGGRGEFRFQDLSPGTYEIQVALEGFEPIRRSVRVGVRSIQNVSLRLTLSRLRQELTVGAPINQINTDTRNNADAVSVEHGVLDNLPLLDLNYLSA